MLRKCTVGKEHRPALFHGWFQYGNVEGGMDANAVVEFEDGTTDYYSAGYITFINEPTAEELGVAALQTANKQSVAEAAQIKPCLSCKFEPECRFKHLCETYCNFYLKV